MPEVPEHAMRVMQNARDSGFQEIAGYADWNSS